MQAKRPGTSVLPHATLVAATTRRLNQYQSQSLCRKTIRVFRPALATWLASIVRGTPEYSRGLILCRFKATGLGPMKIRADMSSNCGRFGNASRYRNTFLNQNFDQPMHA
jgi:hypothetical protein